MRAGAGARSSELAQLGLRWALVIAAWALLFGPSLAAHVASSLDPSLFNDDARQQIWPFFRYYDGPARWHDDYIGRYYLAAFLPAGYRAVMTVLAGAVDPATSSKLLPYGLLAAVVGLSAAAGRRLAGFTAAFCVGALILSSGLVLERLVGGLPRSFAFPVLSLALWACAAGRPLALAAAVVAGAAFYPVAAVAPGVALLLWLLVLTVRDRGRAAAWSLRRRLAVTGGTALVAALLFLPAAIGGRAYGRLIGPADVAEFPEAGPGGRYGPEDRATTAGLPAVLFDTASQALHGDGQPFLPSLRRLDTAGGRIDRAAVLAGLGAAALGLLALASRDSAGRRVAALALSAFVGFLVASVAAPFFFLPQRHVLYPLALLLLVLLPCGAFALAAVAGERGGRRLGPALALGATAGALLLLGGRVAPRTGLTVEASPGDGLQAFLKGLPNEDSVAGWPGGPIEDVPYVARRPVLLSFETEQAFHTGYVLEIRGRMRALIDAMLAVDESPLVALRERYGVTHLVVDRTQLDTRPPDLTLPFPADVDRALARAAGRPLLLRSPPASALVFDDGRRLVIDLGRIVLPDRPEPPHGGHSLRSALAPP